MYRFTQPSIHSYCLTSYQKRLNSSSYVHNSHHHFNSFYGNAFNKKETHHAIMLNYPVFDKASSVQPIWENAEFRLCADGGSNILYDMYADQKERLKRFVPQYICGDLDSLRSDVKQFYNQTSTEIIRVKEQNSTDLMKCINLLDKQFDHITNQEKSNITVVVVGGFGGRFDHMMSNINALFQTSLRIVLYSSSCVAFLLRPGHHIIKRNTQFEGEKCGIIPIGTACRNITTSGLKWNLDQSTMSFGSLVSTSNEFVQDKVTLKTDDPVVWTTVLPKLERHARFN